MRKKIGFVLIAIITLVVASACSNTSRTAETGGSTNELSGVYTGKMTFEKIDEAYITSYRTPREKENIKKAANAEVAQSAEALIANQYKNIVLGVRASAKEGSLTLNITKNDKSQNISSGDYMFVTNAYNKLLPMSSDGSPYWAMFNDKRNGDMNISANSNEIHLSNSKKDETSGAIYTYKLDGSITGTTITGTWSQLWEGAEVYAGRFEVKKTNY